MIKKYLHIVLAAIIASVTLSVSMSYHFCQSHNQFHLASGCTPTTELEYAHCVHHFHDCCSVSEGTSNGLIDNADANVAEIHLSVNSKLSEQHCCKPFFISNALFKEWKPFSFINWKLIAQGIVKKLDLPVNQLLVLKNTALVKQLFLFVPPKISHTCSIVVRHNQLLFYY